MGKIKELSEFTEVAGTSILYIAHRGNLACTAVRLKGESLYLFNPTQGLGRQAQDSLAKLRKVSCLLAPNHYHNLALDR